MVVLRRVLAHLLTNSISSVKRTLLWSNTTSPFAGRTISLNLSKYNAVEIRFYSIGAADVMVPTVLVIPVGNWGQVLYVHALNTTGTNENTGTRTFSVTTSGITISDYKYKNRRTGGTQTIANQFCVPAQIYGIA